MKNLFYFELSEAEQLKNAYESWIGKEAHVGKGQKEKLRHISIVPKHSNRAVRAKYYSVEFLFDQKKFSAHEFLFHNSLGDFSIAKNQNTSRENNV